MGDRKRRLWSDDEKRSICLQSSAPGVSVAQVARRYSMNANLIFKWLRDERFAPAVDGETGPAFLPVEISRDAPVDLPVISKCPPVSTGHLHIELSGGHRVIGEGGFDADALGRFVWPAARDGKISVTPARLSMLLEGIDWRAPSRTWRPLSTG